MADDPASAPPKHVRRMELVVRMTELNSDFLRTQNRRGGLEIEIARCEEAIARDDRSEDFPAALKTLRNELTEVDRSRAEIDQERSRLDKALSALDDPPQDSG